MNALTRPLRHCRIGIEGIAAVFFPPRCSFCNAPTLGSDLCATCRDSLGSDVNHLTCRRCAASVGPYVDPTSGCVQCRDENFAFDSALRLGTYAGDLGAACRRIKRLQASRLASTLAALYFEARESELRSLEVDFVVPTPLHWRRRWTRGYDQAAHIARRLSSLLDKPYRQSLRRVRATADQMQLSPTARRSNVRKAFYCRPDKIVEGATVLLVDDVLTTGSTCHHAARALKSAGAGRVHVAIMARGGDGS